MRKRQQEGGFTLIELLVVIIILGILAAVVVFAVGGIGDKGQASACTIDERTMRTAEEAYSAQPPPRGGGGNYGTEQELLDGGFLSELSEYHDVTPVAGNNGTDGVAGTSDDVPPSFTISNTDTRCPDPSP